MRYFVVEQFVFGYLFSICILYLKGELLPLGLCLLSGFSMLIYRHSKFHRKHRAIMLCVFVAGVLLAQYLYSLFLVKREVANIRLQSLEKYEIAITSFGDTNMFGVSHLGCVTINDSCAKVIVKLGKGQGVSRGDVLQVYGNFSTFKSSSKEYEQYLWNLGHVGEIRPTSPIYIADNLGELDKIVLTIRSAILSQLQELSFPANQIVPGVLVGSKESIDQPTKDVFMSSGLIHILVLSGYNISIVALFVFYILRFSPYVLRLVISAGVTYILVLISGSEEPAVRAYITTMLALVLLPNLSNTKNAVRITAYAAFIVLIVSPETIYSISFQLSTLATLAVFTIGTILSNREIHPVLSVLGITTAAQIFTLPTILLLSGEYNLSSLLANIIVAPIVPIIMFFAAIYSVVPLQMVGDCIELASRLIYTIATAFSGNLSLVLRFPISHETSGALNIALVFLLVLFSSSVCNQTYKNYNNKQD